MRPRDPAASAARVRLAVQRGLVSRAFAADPRLARCRSFPLAFGVGPTGSELHRLLLLRGDDRETIPVERLGPRWSDPGVGDWALVVLGTPFAHDVVTSPFQLVFFLAIGEVVGGAGAHHGASCWKHSAGSTADNR